MRAHPYRAALMAIAVIQLASCGAKELQTPLPLPNSSRINALEDAPWRVSAVNGRKTPSVGDYSLRFEAGKLAAKFGCNSMGGTYRFESSALIVSDLSQTLIGCPEPAASFELQGSAVLREPMNIARSANGDIQLTNGSGAITLVPIVTAAAI